MKSTPTRAPDETSCHLDQNLDTVSKIPSCRTPPLRPPSAIAPHTVALCTSNPTYVILPSGPSPCRRLYAGHPAQPSTLCTAEDGPPITQRTSGLVRGGQRRGCAILAAAGYLPARMLWVALARSDHLPSLPASSCLGSRRSPIARRLVHGYCVLPARMASRCACGSAPAPIIPPHCRSM